MSNVTNLESARKRWIRVNVDVFEHDVLQGGPFSKREAWLWLIANAAWHEKTIYHKGKRITLQPGDILAGRKFLAETWGWSEKSVRGFVGQCIAENMLVEGQSKGHYANVYTIVNYEKFQCARQDGASAGASQGPEPPVERARPAPSSPVLPEEDNNLGSSTTPRASEISEEIKIFGNDEKRKDWSCNKLKRRAEGLGLPVDEIWNQSRARKPKNPHAYLTRVCVDHVKRDLPNVSEGVIREYLMGNDEAGRYLFAAYCGGVQ